MSNGAVPHSLFPIATDKEHLLASVFGEIPLFLSPERREQLLVKAEEGSELWRLRLRECCLELREHCHSAFASQPKDASVHTLLRAAVPLQGMPRKRQKVVPTPRPQNRKDSSGADDGDGGATPPKMTRSGAKYASRRWQPPRSSRIVTRSMTLARRLAAAERRERRQVQPPPPLPPPNGKAKRWKKRSPRAGVEVKKEAPVADVVASDVSLPSRRRSSRASATEKAIALHLASPPLFADALLAMGVNSGEVRRQMICQFPRQESNATPKRDFEASFTSPLKSAPSLVRNTKLFYSLQESSTPYCRTWANKLDMQWPLCGREIIHGACSETECPYQHSSDYDLSTAEKWRYSRFVGEVDRQGLSGNARCSLLHWPTATAEKRIVRDDIPSYHRTVAPEGQLLPLSSIQTQSSLLRSVQVDHEMFKARSVQLSMDYTWADIPNLLSSEEEQEGGLSRQTSLSAAESSEMSDEVDVLMTALSMIEGDRCLERTSRESALKFLSNKLAIYPHHRPLWQLYLSLFLRDPGESPHSKQHQVQICESMCGPWYRRSLMVAAVTPGVTTKIFILKKAIVAHLKEKQQAIPPHISACCMDLALRIAYAEVSTMKDPFTDEGSSCFALMLAVKTMWPPNTGIPWNSDAVWIQTLLETLHRYPEQCYTFCLAIIHARLYGALPSSIVHAFGFPKKLVVFKWTTKVPFLNDLSQGITNRASQVMYRHKIEDMLYLLKWATHTSFEDQGFFHLLKDSPDSLPSVQALIANVLLMFRACQIQNTLECFQALFPHCQELKKIVPMGQFVFLDIAKTLDSVIESMSHADSVDQDHGRGFVLEHVLVSFLTTGGEKIVQEWNKKESFCWTLVSQRILLAVSKSTIMVKGTSADLQLMDGAFLELMDAMEQQSDEDQNPNLSKPEKFFSCLSALCNCVLAESAFNLESFLCHASNLSQHSQALTERLWMEMIVLSATALPRNDPRKATAGRNVKAEEDAMDIDIANAVSEISFPVVREFLAQRSASFFVVLSLIKIFIKEHVPSVEALDTFQEDLSSLPLNVKSVLAPPKMHNIESLLDHIRILVPYFYEHEIVKIAEFLCEAFPSSPALAEFLLDLLAFLPNNERSCVRMLITILLHSVPCAGFQVWNRAVVVATAHGHTLARDLVSMTEKVYPEWKRN